jgi:3-methylfumaryl-CoA hydratase
LTLADLGVPAETEATIDTAHALRIAATLNREVDVADGAPLPSLWHWAYFTPTARTEHLGLDGHPRLVSPQLEGLPRRMWGAGSVTWHGALIVGQMARRLTRLASVKATQGASGNLLIVGLDHQYLQGDRVVIDEQQSIVYRSPGDPVPLPVDRGTLEPPEDVAQGEIRPDEPQLFRFSAITFNAHRIHYDRPYATAVEGYPGLVVHGPLTSMNLANHVECTTQRPLAYWQFRATAPMFAGCRQWLRSSPADSEGHGEAEVLRNDHVVAMTATYRIGDPRE